MGRDESRPYDVVDGPRSAGGCGADTQVRPYETCLHRGDAEAPPARARAL